jgi:hypothetical protein
MHLTFYADGIRLDEGRFRHGLSEKEILSFPQIFLMRENLRGLGGNLKHKNRTNTLWLRVNYYTQKIGGHRKQWISHKMNILHPGQLKKLKSWGLFWSYQLNSTANLANLANLSGKWAKLTVLSSW